MQIWHRQLKPLPMEEKKNYLFHIINITGADDLPMQWANDTATMLLTCLNRDNSLLEFYAK